MRIVITGASGFLGWHTRARLHATTDHEIVPVTRANWTLLPDLLKSADAVIHIAGINRASDDEVRQGNVALAEDVATAIAESAGRPAIVYANSTHSTSKSPYGIGKHLAARVLEKAASAAGSKFTEVILPNLFGEHGRANYNSFVATFIQRVIRGESPDVQDRQIELLNAQQAANALIEAITAPERTVSPQGTLTTVQSVLDTLTKQYSCYSRGEIPILASRLQIDLFNALRAEMFPEHYPMPLTRHMDKRGTLVETVRAHGSEGQTFISTSGPGVTRGQHFHLRKVERFVVIQGRARISLRRLLTDETVTFDVNGETPTIVDIPTLWVHNIQNTAADQELTTMFWTNELFDPDDADTYPEEV